MKSKEIKQNVENYQKTIREWNQAIEELQKICNHSETLRDENATPKEVCLDCGKRLSDFHNNQLHFNEVKYFEICEGCRKGGNCGCTIRNTTVRQYFQQPNSND